MVQVAIIGYGTVGSGVAEVIERNAESIAKKAGQKIEVKYICDIRDFTDDPNQDKLIKDFSIILNDPDISVVVESIGGLKPAYQFVKDSLLAHKSVVTSNKELVATKGWELLKIAREQGVNFLFEASVGGGTPIIRPMHQCLAANQFDEIAGILNGTTNFMLTKMAREGLSFDEALALAQQLGYAETIDPSADVDGHDCCRKICILASLAFGRHIFPDQVPTSGIRTVTTEDIALAGQLGYAIKLIGRAKKQEDGRVFIEVCPALVDRASQLSTVDDVFNGILVRSDMLGDVLFYGRGAGKLPTASAVVADIIDTVRSENIHQSLYWEKVDEDFLQDAAQDVCGHYLRVACADTAKVLEVAELVFGQLGRCESCGAYTAFVTAEQSQRDFENARDKLAALLPVENCMKVMPY